MDFHTIRLIEAVIALYLFSTRFPSVARLARESLSLLSSLLRNPLANFVAFNSIILVLFLLSRHSPASSSSPDDEDLKIVAFSPEPHLETSPPVAEEKRKKAVEKEKAEDPIEEARREIRRFERTHSASLRREIQRVVPRHQLRRSETDINKKEKNKSAEIKTISVINRVDALSNEEFQRTIEEFIAKQQRFLWAQKMAEIE